MKLSEIKTTQHRLHDLLQLPGIVSAVLNNEPINKVILFEDSDGFVAICDGHHRVMAYWLAGRTELYSGEYLLVQADFTLPRFGGLQKLWERVCS